MSKYWVIWPVDIKALHNFAHIIINLNVYPFCVQYLERKVLLLLEDDGILFKFIFAIYYYFSLIYP